MHRDGRGEDTWPTYEKGEYDWAYWHSVPIGEAHAPDPARGLKGNRLEVFVVSMVDLWPPWGDMVRARRRVQAALGGGPVPEKNVRWSWKSLYDWGDWLADHLEYDATPLEVANHERRPNAWLEDEGREGP